MSNHAQVTSVPSVFNFQSTTIRTFLNESKEIEFCAKDVCDILGYINDSDAVKKHCKQKGVAKRDTLTSGGIQSLTFINEPNLYRLIVKSRKPEAEAFEAWVMEEVLPAIRKTGRYQYRGNNDPTETLMELLSNGRWLLTVDNGSLKLKPVDSDAFILPAARFAAVLREPAQVPISLLPDVISACAERLKAIQVKTAQAA